MRLRTVAATAAALTVLAGCAADTAEVPAPSPDAETAELCRTLVQRLPDTVVGQERVATRPDSDHVAAWGDPPVAVRCGVERPTELAPDSHLRTVNGIAWFPEPGDRPTLFTAVGREAYVELDVPPSYGAPARGLVEVGDVIADTVPALPDGEV
ncbi:uncharacterized protein DUF3515 [Haloactinospora alba]|uniref:Uncharacterized protein DUF3515 n=1 Tax=Haloactinospora alba TaxID=405555 RepID=A0A543NFR6_9ACTN|nr:DUF3515 domain-containing protein [Haloactinospora alba]TQN30682.1 uncharacterized protein DUF3515 [Haloactinospora alba]